ncbi:MAG: DUF1732 domain-containing protein [Nannocystaceae bacterium]
MTGFGVARRTWEAGDRPHAVVVEVRGVNQRFLEVKIRSPLGAAIEPVIRQRVEARVGRGRLDLAVFSQRVDEPGAGPSEGPRVDAVLARLAELRRSILDAGLEVSPVNPLELLEYLNRPSRPQAAAPEAPAEPPEALVLACVDDALAGLMVMREAEGQALEVVLRDLLAALEAQVAELAASLDGEAERLHERLHERVTALCQRAGVEGLSVERVVQEVALWVQRGDVSEELARIDSHLAQARGVLDAPAHAGQGKTLDFLSQELFREITTIGSKITSHAGSGLAIAAKGSVERIREQVQNVE